MSHIVSVLIGIILMTQLDIVYSDTGLCYFCKDFLNALQCGKNSANGCIWKNGACSGTLTPSITNQTPLSCAQQNATICSGYEINSSNLRCILNSGSSVCTSFDVTMACASFNYQQCNTLQNCKWNSSTTSNGSTNGSCVVSSCNLYVTNTTCSAIFTTGNDFSASPCKWIQNTTTNTSSCGNGAASDLSLANCNLFSAWFTYSDSGQVCTACQQTLQSISVGSKFLQLAAFYSLVIALGL